MFAKGPDEASGLQKTINTLFEEMASVSADSEEYSKMADQLVKIYTLKEQDAPKRVSPDTLALVLGNLLGIVMIVGHERTHVITTRARDFMLKLK